MEWIKATRPKPTIMAGILVLAGFKINLGYINSYSLMLFVFVVLGAAATMIWNDYCDRFHDQQKGKYFASINSSKFLVLSMILWGITVAFGGLIWWIDVYSGKIAGLLIILGFSYSWTRRVPLLSGLIVAFNTVLTVMFSANTNLSMRLVLFALIVLFYVYASEILQDVRDPHDLNYKKTLPVLLGVKWSKLVAAGLFAAVIGLSFRLAFVSGLVLFIPGLILIWGLLKNHEHTKRKILLDGTTLLFVLVLIFIPEGAFAV